MNVKKVFPWSFGLLFTLGILGCAAVAGLFYWASRDLPDLEQFAPDEQSRQFIRERLSGRSIQSTLEEQAEDLDEERELLDTDVEEAEAVEDEGTLDVDATSEDLHDEE